MSDWFASIRVGDKVKDVRASDDFNPFTVVKVTAKRFVCDIGENPVLGCRMFQDFRKSDGRSVGGRCYTFVRPANAVPKKGNARDGSTVCKHSNPEPMTCPLCRAESVPKRGVE